MLGALNSKWDGWFGVCPALLPPLVQVFLKTLMHEMQLLEQVCKQPVCGAGWHEQQEAGEA